MKSKIKQKELSPNSRKHETKVYANPGLSVNRLSNNRAQFLCKAKILVSPTLSTRHFYCLRFSLFCFRLNSSIRNKTGTHVFWENGVDYPRVSPGAHPLAKKTEDSGYEIGFLTKFPRKRDWSLYFRRVSWDAYFKMASSKATVSSKILVSIRLRIYT